MSVRHVRSIRWVAVVLLVVCVSGPAHAQSVSALRSQLSAPHALRDAAARQRPAHVTRRNTGRGSGTATKVTVGTAMGIAGFFAGAYVGFLAQNGATTPGDGRAAVMTGGLVGAGAGAALGVWLASR